MRRSALVRSKQPAQGTLVRAAEAAAAESRPPSPREESPLSPLSVRLQHGSASPSVRGEQDLKRRGHVTKAFPHNFITSPCAAARGTVAADWREVPRGGGSLNVAVEAKLPEEGRAEGRIAYHHAL